MVVLKICNSTCTITGLMPQRFQSLRSASSVRQKTGRMVRGKSGKRFPETRTTYMIDKRGEFSTGLLYLVEEFLQAKNLKYEISDLRRVPKLNQFPEDKVPATYAFEPYPEQDEAAIAALTYTRGIIVGPTGVGKSAIAARICDGFRVPTLIVVPSLELKAQLTASLSEIFGHENVGELNRKGYPTHFISVENVDALDPRKPQQGIDLVIIDEFHHAGAKTYRVLSKQAWKGIYHRLGLTATPFRSNEDERLLLESVLSQVIYRIEYKTAVAKGYIVPLEVYYVELPAIELKKNLSYASVYKQLIVDRKDRNALIAELTYNLVDAGRSVLVLTKQIEHGLKLQTMIEDIGYDIPFVKGENDNNRDVIGRFSSGEERGLVGTTGVIGEGVDTRAAEWAVLAAGGKSKNAFMQQIGRVFRLFGDKQSGKVIMFYDPSHKWMIDHFDACVKYLLDEYGVIPVKLDLP